MAKFSDLSAGQAAFVIIAVAILVPALFFGTCWLVMVLWNYLVPALFSGPTVTYWQAVAGWFLICMIGSVFRSRK